MKPKNKIEQGSIVKSKRNETELLKKRIAELEQEKQAAFEQGLIVMNQYHQQITEQYIYPLFAYQMEIEHRLALVESAIADKNKSLPVDFIRRIAIDLGDLINRADILNKEAMRITCSDIQAIDLSVAVMYREAMILITSGADPTGKTLKSIIAETPALDENLKLIKLMKKRGHGDDSLRRYEMMAEYVDAGMVIDEAAAKIATLEGVGMEAIRLNYFRIEKELKSHRK